MFRDTERQSRREAQRYRGLSAQQKSPVSSPLAGLSLVEDFPYEPEERGSDYVRLASIAAGGFRASGAGRRESRRRQDPRWRSCVLVFDASEPVGEPQGRNEPRRHRLMTYLL